MPQWDVYPYGSASFNHSTNQWRTDTDALYQDSYGYGNWGGLWFLGQRLEDFRYQTWLAGVGPGNIERCQIWIYRASSGGSSAAMPVYGWLHANQWHTGAWPIVQDYLGILAWLSWGQSAWVDIPVWAAQRLWNRQSHGIRIGDNGSGSAYLILNGVQAHGSSGCLRMTYSVPAPVPPPPPQAPQAPQLPQVTVGPDTLPVATVGEPYLAQLWGDGGAGGGYNLWITDDPGSHLPAGLSFGGNAISGWYISGTPVASGPGWYGPDDYWIRVGAWDAASGWFGYRWLIITLKSSPSISTTSLPSGQVRVPYEEALVASGGREPYAWDAEGATLPSGLSIASSGEISGTPLSAGASQVLVRLVDSLGQVADKQLSLTIAPNVPTEPRNVVAVAGNGQASVSWQVPLDQGGDGLITGYVVQTDPGSSATVGDVTSHIVSGLTNNVAYRFRVRAVNAAGNGAWSEWSDPVTPAAFRITTELLPPAFFGQYYRVALETTGEIPPTRWRLLAGELPRGLSLDRRTGIISGVPEAPEEEP